MFDIYLTDFLYYYDNDNEGENGDYDDIFRYVSVCNNLNKNNRTDQFTIIYNFLW